MCKVCTEAVHCAALWTCVQVQKNVIIPTPPYPMWCVRGWLWVEKMMQNCPVCTCDSSLCARVTLENGCVRTWLQSVCAGDSGWKNDAKLCLCVLVTSECVRGWPPDPPKWIVYNGKPYSNGWFGGYHHFWNPPGLSFLFHSISYQLPDWSLRRIFWLHRYFRYPGGGPPVWLNNARLGFSIPFLQ